MSRNSCFRLPRAFISYLDASRRAESNGHSFNALGQTVREMQAENHFQQTSIWPSVVENARG